MVTTGRYANHQPLARRDLPVTVVNSYEWQTRCKGRREFLHRGPDVAKLFALAVDKRREQLTPFRNPIPGNWRFDMAYCKMRRDVGYVEELWELLDHADFREADGPAAELLCYQEKVLGGSRTDLAWYGRHTTINRQVHVDLNRRRFERCERHVHGVLVPYHCHEIEYLAPATIGMRYPPLPSWWVSREATYSNLAELPRVASYLGSMCENPYSNVCYIAQTEWAANQAAEVVACARAGKLL